MNYRNKERNMDLLIYIYLFILHNVYIPIYNTILCNVHINKSHISTSYTKGKLQETKPTIIDYILQPRTVSGDNLIFGCPTCQIIHQRCRGYKIRIAIFLLALPRERGDGWMLEWFRFGRRIRVFPPEHHQYAGDNET